MKLNETSKVIAVVTLVAIAIFCALPAVRVNALPNCSGYRNLKFTFGMLGITPGQTARLSVVNALPGGPPQIPVGPPSRVTLMFVDSNGNPFSVGGAPLHTTVTLLPGQSGFLDLNGDAIPVGPPNLPSGPPNRVQIRAVVSDCEGCSRGFVVPTLEVFDNTTGRTMLVMPDSEGSLREIAYALDVLKADGIGLMTNYEDKWPGHSAFAPVFEELNRRKAVVFFHPTAASCCKELVPGVPRAWAELPHDTTRAVLSLLVSGTLARLRNIRFIFSHAGGTIPMLAGRIIHAGNFAENLAEKAPHGIEYELKRLYYDMAISANRSTMAALMNLIPTTQILFGGDYPFAPIAATANGMTTVELAANALQAIGRDNALELMPRLKA